MKYLIQRYRLFSHSRFVICALIGILVLGTTATAATKDEVKQLVIDEAARNGHVPIALALGVARVESNFNERAISYAGARGVMQIMPATAMNEFGVSKEELMDPRVNVELGIAYLNRLYNLYGHDWSLALSHYNGGSLPVVGGRYITHDYNRQYVSDVINWANYYQTNDTLLAAADTGEGVGVSAAGEATGRYPTYNDIPTKQAEPDWTQIRRVNLAQADGSMMFSEMLSQSKQDLREKFRASITHPDIDNSAEAGADRDPTQVNNQVWPNGDAPHPTATGTPTGRFNYAPYGSGRIL